MKHEQDLISQMKSRGIRVTPQRAIILQVMQDDNHIHMTAEDVFQAAQRVNRFINLATVYRTLDLLRDLGMVTTADMGAGAVQFALNSHANHHHAMCRSCGASSEFPDSWLADLSERLLHEMGFLSDANHMVLLGLCADCRRTSASPSTASLGR
jgi:Fur family ferric uptake transcriptional regulator